MTATEPPAPHTSGPHTSAPHTSGPSTPDAFDADRVRAFLKESPIAGWLGLGYTAANGARHYTLRFNETHIGNPMIRALHGGVISAFLETAMQADLVGRLSDETGPFIGFRSISFDIDFLTSSKAADMTAAVQIERLGSRLAFLSAVGWQGDVQKPVARASLCLRLGAPEPVSP